ncbi:MAG: NADH-quinone oxidoreductase subunit J [Bacteroidia bacterium]|nr:NADH-quinone oxidoreductase subunit J [Bacteroidia bacterium]
MGTYESTAFWGMFVVVLTIVSLSVCGALALIGGALAVTLRDPIYAVLALVKAMLGLAGIYFLLGAEYVGAIQVIVYAGAILVTFLFVVMLVNLSPEDIPPFPRGIALYGNLILAVAWLLLLSTALSAILEIPAPEQVLLHVEPLPYLYGTLPPLGKALFTAYAFPFELLSVTLLIGIVGASLLVQKRPSS